MFWEENLAFEIAHLHKAAELLKKYEKKDWQEVIPCGDFPEPISLHENIDYVRKILSETVQFTSTEGGYVKVGDLPSDAEFFKHQGVVNPTVQIVPSHNVIDDFIKRRGMDYRYQIAPSPILELRSRREDNTTVGRMPNAAQSTGFYCNTCI